MPSKLLRAAHRLLESQVESGTHITVNDDACYAWLRDTPLKALHPSSRTVCLGVPDSVALVRLVDDGATLSDSDNQYFPQPLTSPEHITALQWACFAKSNASRESKEESYLLIGTSTGHLQLHGSDAQLLHRQRLHARAVTAISVRCAGMQAGSDNASEDITICFEDAVARVSSLELQSLMYLRKTVGTSVKWPSLGFNKWDTSRKTGRRQSAICAGVQPPSLYASMYGSDAGHPLVLITVGRSPAMAAFTVSEHAANGALQLITGLATSAVSGAAGLAKTALVGRQDGYRAGIRKWLIGRGGSMGSHPELSLPQQPEKEPKEEPPPPGEPATLWRSVKDEPRSITSLIAAPRGALAAMTDSLGRVQILDTAGAAVVRILKGYRDARCAWVLLPASSAAADSASRLTQQTGAREAASEHAPSLELLQASDAHEQSAVDIDAGGVGAKAAGRRGDNSSDTSSQDSFASARDASLAPMDTDKGDGVDQQSSASWELRAALPGDGASCDAEQSGASDTVSARAPGRRSGGYQTAERRLLLAVHAPRRGVVDVWQVAHGPRLCSIRAGPHCCLLTVPPLLGLGNAAGVAAASDNLDSYLLDCVTGQLESLTEAVASALRIVKPRLE